MKLVTNEMIKIFKKVSTYIMIGIVALIIFGVGGLYKYIDVTEGPAETDPNWKQTLQEENKMNQENLTQVTDERDKNYMERSIAINNYQIENNIAPQYGTDTWSFMYDMAMMINFLSIITITVAAGIVANEFSTGTIKLLLIRPVSRLKILLSKYASVILFSGIIIAFTFVLSLIVGAILFGFGDVQPHLVYQDGKVIEQSQFVASMINFFFSSIGLFMLTTMAFMISAAFRNSSLAIGISIFLLLMGTSLTQMLSYKFDWAKYILFANLDLNSYIQGMPFMSGMTMTFSIVVLLIYFVVFHLIAIVFFTKRDITA